ncbi:hypothetical protein Taro_047766 [Colocasia esculenta]|uniref:5' exonuclease Apollo n=1 Tax=Colocasia esculenta TaxID=4460 RepID=A0A843X807_COLES|nr:hypothetical protein [Colocasia esculenta]
MRLFKHPPFRPCICVAAMEKGLIAVDRWGEASQAYFLTHLHADHTRGLFPGWAKGPLFCSPVTARLLPSRFPGFELSLLRVLDVGVPRPLTLDSPTSGTSVSIRVTAIDACHCPGAVMYLFQGDLGCVLYTGDFRWEPTDKRAWVGKKALLSALGGDEVDVLHLDNTFCNPCFEFHPREVAAQQVVDIIKSHPDHDIVICIDTLGKEELLVQVSDSLNTKVWVWPERLQTMDLLGYDRVFTTKSRVTRVRAIPRYSFTVETLIALNTLRPTVGILPSGLPWEPNSFQKDPSLDLAGENTSINSGRGQKETQVPKKCHQYIFSVPYSSHSCYSEIREFIKLVRPSKVRGIVFSSFCYINPRHFFGSLCTSYQPSGQPSTDLGKNRTADGVRETQTVYAVACELPRRERCMKGRATRMGWLGVRRSWTSPLRRQRRGVKISEEADHG